MGGLLSWFLTLIHASPNEGEDYVKANRRNDQKKAKKRAQRREAKKKARRVKQKLEKAAEEAERVRRKEQGELEKEREEATRNKNPSGYPPRTPSPFVKEDSEEPWQRVALKGHANTSRELKSHKIKLDLKKKPQVHGSFKQQGQEGNTGSSPEVKSSSQTPPATPKPPALRLSDLGEFSYLPSQLPHPLLPPTPSATPSMSSPASSPGISPAPPIQGLFTQFFSPSPSSSTSSYSWTPSSPPVPSLTPSRASFSAPPRLLTARPFSPPSPRPLLIPLRNYLSSPENRKPTAFALRLDFIIPEPFPASQNPEQAL